MTKKLFLLLLSSLSLSACSTSNVGMHQCPQVAIVRDLDRVEDYGREAADPSTLVAVAEMDKINGSCRYEEKGIDIVFDLVMKGKKGPRLGGDRISFPYFVSLISPKNEVLSKEVMTAEFVYPEKEKQITLVEPLHVFVPFEKIEEGPAYRVLSGFQLTEDQYKAARAAAGK